ncbi:MAG TPA: CHAP domain-containing protein [Candidatus Saccharimonadales bacterium]|nr:CHAP domain-containing protein [Candidatus Saccharimonadales bacterium]
MQKQNRAIIKMYHRVRLVACVLTLAGLIGGAAFVHADQFDDQINALRGQNANIQGLLNGLESAASGYQQVIAQLQQQIDSVQAALSANQAQQAALQAQITKNQQDIDTKKANLAATIKQMYIDGQTSTIEELASSKNLSDYVDKEEGQVAVQNQLTQTIAQIAALQAQLQKQKAQLDTLIASEQAQHDQLASAQAQQNQLLAYNEGQQSAYNSQLNANSSQIAELRRQQIIANNRYNIGDFKGSPDNGGYPNAWANAPQDSLIDTWGMYNRECVSYTAFRVHQDYLAGKNNRDMPYWGGVGNANQWDDNARAAGIPVDTNPTPGSIAISNAGAFGHAMYVEAVNGNEIYVQQYNQQLNGQYSEGWRYTTGLVFIHF